MSDLDKWILHGDEMRRPFLANSKLSESSKLVIVGGGLSGLSCAFRIAKKRPDIEIITSFYYEVAYGFKMPWI